MITTPEQDRFAKHHESLLAISTSHGTPTCINTLEREATSQTSHGFLLNIPDEEVLTSEEYRAALNNLNLSKSLVQLLVDAQRAGINWILFDADAEPVNDYATYESTWP